MRVLWFSITPSLAAKKVSQDVVGLGWVESLEEGLKAFPDIELGVAFKKPVKKLQEVEVEGSNTRYFMVPQYPSSRAGRGVERLLARPLSRKSLPHYLEVVKEFKPDVILFFGSEFDFPLIIPELKVPSIVWFQGNLTVYKEMYENGLRIKNTLYFESIKRFLKCYTAYHEYRLFLRRVEREQEIFSFAKNFIGRTAWDKRVVRVMAPQANYFHVEDALRELFWKHQWSEHTDRKKFIVTTAIRGVLYKGLETIYKTAILLEDALGNDFEWHVIGINEGTAYVKASKKHAKYDKNRSSVKLLGPKFGNELAQQLIMADAYVHPSHIENSCNAIKEAMLLGVPVVATDVGGTQSLFPDNNEGIMVQSKDPYAMAGAILELYESPEKAKEMGENARLLGLKRNDINKICRDLIETFEEVIKQGKEQTP